MRAIYARVIAGEDILDPGEVAGARDHGLDGDGLEDYELSFELESPRRALEAVLDDPGAPRRAALDDALRAVGSHEVILALRDELVSCADERARRLVRLARALATEAVEFPAVKLALALLARLPAAGGADADADADLLFALGRHEELTRYAVDGLPEPRRFALAQLLHGWGRIAAVRSLAGTRDPAIQAWMLREGYRNTIGVAYVAHACATTGQLGRALAAEHVDAALLAGAGALLAGLLARGAPEGIESYDDGAVVAERWIHHLGAAPMPLAALEVVGALERFLAFGPEAPGWTPARRALVAARLAAVKDPSRWRPAIEAGFASTDARAFAEAQQAAAVLGIDPWELHFARIAQRLDDGWSFVVQTEDPARLARVAALAEQRLLADAGGCAHQDLGLVVAALGRVPGAGVALIQAALQSPVPLTRRLAEQTLTAWDSVGKPIDT